MDFEFLSPYKAPIGVCRAIDFVNSCLNDRRFDRARFAVAFARKAGVTRVIPAVQQLRARGGRAEIIVGIDHNGTSEEALRLLHTTFDKVSILYAPTRRVTFHPKMYLFDGGSSARALIGSHNLTQGGLELNYEAGVVISVDLLTDSSHWEQFEDAWSAMLPVSSPSSAAMTSDLIDQLVSCGLVQTEATIRTLSTARFGASSAMNVEASQLPFSSIVVAPPSSFPIRSVQGPTVHQPGSTPSTMATASIFLIEVKPRHNAEVTLSWKAIRQNPGFFRWPWSGKTSPKFKRNEPYPKMDPHPTIKLDAYDLSGSLTLRTTIHPEVMKYRNADVRMTVGKEVVDYIPDYALFVIRHPDEGVEPGFDYEIEVHPEGSPGHRRWIGRCDQRLGGGGSTRPRRMGWV